MLTETHTWTGIFIVVCFVILPIFWLFLLIFLNQQYKHRIKSFHDKAINVDLELQTLRKRYNQSWVVIQQQHKTIMDQNQSKLTEIKMRQMS